MRACSMMRRREVAAPSFYMHLQPGESFVGAGPGIRSRKPSAAAPLHPRQPGQLEGRRACAGPAQALRFRGEREAGASAAWVSPPTSRPIDDPKPPQLGDVAPAGRRRPLTGPRLLSTLGKDRAALGLVRRLPQAPRWILEF
ncbi:hypothetical protein ACE0DR_25935 [Azotobacter sp. CWF10]